MRLLRDTRMELSYLLIMYEYSGNGESVCYPGKDNWT